MTQTLWQAVSTFFGNLPSIGSEKPKLDDVQFIYRDLQTAEMKTLTAKQLKRLLK